MLAMLLPPNAIEEFEGILDLIFDNGAINALVDVLNNAGINNRQVNDLIDVFEDIMDFEFGMNNLYTTWMMVMMDIMSDLNAVNIPNRNIALFMWYLMDTAGDVIENLIEIFENDPWVVEDLSIALEAIDAFMEMGRTNFVNTVTLMLDIETLIFNTAFDMLPYLFEMAMEDEFLTRDIFNRMINGFRTDALAVLDLLDRAALASIIDFNMFTAQMVLVYQGFDISEFDPIINAFLDDWNYIRASLRAMLNATSNTAWTTALFNTLRDDFNGDSTWQEFDDAMAIIFARVFNAGLTASNGLNNARAIALAQKYYTILMTVFTDVFGADSWEVYDIEWFFDEIMTNDNIDQFFADVAAVAALPFGAELGDDFDDNLFIIFLRSSGGGVGDVYVRPSAHGRFEIEYVNMQYSCSVAGHILSSRFDSNEGFGYFYGLYIQNNDGAFQIWIQFYLDGIIVEGYAFYTGGWFDMNVLLIIDAGDVYYCMINCGSDHYIVLDLAFRRVRG